MARAGGGEGGVEGSAASWKSGGMKPAGGNAPAAVIAADQFVLVRTDQLPDEHFPADRDEMQRVDVTVDDHPFRRFGAAQVGDAVQGRVETFERAAPFGPGIGGDRPDNRTDRAVIQPHSVSKKRSECGPVALIERAGVAEDQSLRLARSAGQDQNLNPASTAMLRGGSRYLIARGTLVIGDGRRKALPIVFSLVTFFATTARCHF